MNPFLELESGESDGFVYDLEAPEYGQLKPHVSTVAVSPDVDDPCTGMPAQDRSVDFGPGISVRPTVRARSIPGFICTFTP